MKPPLIPCSLGTQIGSLIGGQWPPNETADRVFQGQNCLFTCPVLDVYRYHTFSFSKLSSLTLRTLNFKERHLRENQIKNTFLTLKNHSHMHQNIIQHFLAQLGCLLAWVLVNTHSLVSSSLLSYIISVLFIIDISYIICIFLEYILDTKQRLLC